MSQAPGLRQARESDLLAIVALYADDRLGAQREKVGETVHENYLNAFKEIDKNPDNEIHVALIDDRIVGVFQLVFLQGLSHAGLLRAEIEAVRVASDLRGHGIGKIMMEFAIKRAQARGAKMVQLASHKTRPEAHRFYERLGFEMSHVGMKLKL